MVPTKYYFQRRLNGNLTRTHNHHLIYGLGVTSELRNKNKIQNYFLVLQTSNLCSLNPSLLVLFLLFQSQPWSFFIGAQKAIRCRSGFETSIRPICPTFAQIHRGADEFQFRRCNWSQFPFQSPCHLWCLLSNQAISS